MRIKKRKNWKILLILFIAVMINGCGYLDILDASMSSEVNILSYDSMDELELVFNKSLDTNIITGWSVSFAKGDLVLNESNASIKYSTTRIKNDTMTINPIIGNRVYRNIAVNGIYDTEGNIVSGNNILWKCYSKWEES